MSQPTLQMEPAVIEAEIVEPTENRALTKVRTDMFAMQPAELQAGLAEYDATRKTFREWLLSHMVEGVHFGTPPGCEPKLDERGWVGVYTKGGMKYYPPEQWRPKPSLYKAGAHLIVDLLQLVEVYESDELAWRMMGSPVGTVVRTCRLYPKGKQQTPENLRGHGTGARVLGQKGGDANNCVKMADKNALVAAALNCVACADLFTQDMEDGQSKAEFEAPEEKPTAAKVQPRGKRIAKADHDFFKKKFVNARKAANMPADQSAFETFVSEQCGREINPLDPATWTEADLQKCEKELEATRSA